MARPKTYSDQDIIETAMQLVQQKKEVKAWRIREILGRGKLTSIQSDLDRLIADNEINIEVDETEVNNDVVTIDDTLNVDLPVEIFDTFKIVETELSASLLDLLQRLNNEEHKHHNQLTKTRLSQATKALEDAISAKARAETEVIESENRVRLNERINDLIGSNAKLEQGLNNQQIENEKLLDLNAEKLNEINETKAINNNLVNQNNELNKNNLELTTEVKFNNERIAELNESLKDKDSQINNFVQSIK
ncbi:hypothetical protein PLEI_2975 [Photobacterium leiognathi lrivu.4.1]|uniref:Uncharacterized protein n=1 Tax=Photobacterium leiognathi lrivu.4.1 TaxID=1248232 RepID=V5H2I6_PHOLE|nr:hypothetical protein [Photobacterium leiognathi]GAD31317.1 hypothetical protein PLEI_2975 [Photobacterium leiognathi lrivu.4.1]